MVSVRGECGDGDGGLAEWGLGRQPGPRASCPVTARGEFGPGASVGSSATPAPRLPRLYGDHGEGHQGTVVTLDSGVSAREELRCVASPVPSFCTVAPVLS